MENPADEYFLHNQRGRLLEWVLLASGNERVFAVTALSYFGERTQFHLERRTMIKKVSGTVVVFALSFWRSLPSNEQTRNNPSGTKVGFANGRMGIIGEIRVPPPENLPVKRRSHVGCGLNLSTVCFF